MPENWLDDLDQALDAGNIERARELIARRRQPAAAAPGEAIEAGGADFQTLFHAVSDPLFVLDAGNDAIVEANAAAARLLDVTRADLLATPISAIHPFEMEQLRQLAETVHQQGEARMRGMTCRNRHGIFIPAEVAATRVELGGRPLVLARALDLRQEPAPDAGDPLSLSEYRQMQDALATTRHLLHYAPEMVLWIHPDGRIRYANETAAEQLGTSRDVLERRCIWDLDVDATRESFPLHAARLRTSGERVRMERRMQSEDGTVFPVQVTAQLVTYGQEEVIVSFSRDLSEEARARSEARRYLDDLARVSRQATVSEMAAALSHEINQPLTALLSRNQACIRLLERGNADAVRLRRGLEDAVGNAERIQAIVSQLRDYVRSGSSERETVALADILAEVGTLLRAEARHKGVNLHIDGAESAVLVQADRILIEQVIINLARNAMEAMVEHGSERRELAIEVEPGDDDVAVQVSDSGPGIDPAMQDHLFEPYFSSKADGLGIGLSLCRSIVESHDGSIALASPTLGGTTFRFTLPAAGASNAREAS